MNRNKIEELDEFLWLREETLRVVFINGEIYDLCKFSTGHDNDEEFPHCSALFVSSVNTPAPEHELPWAMFFHLNEVAEIRDATTDEVIYRL